ncbi:Undecaprenyl-phosphate glucose phosphotransferase [Hymenobacter roseosalivarius DSM 11622]|uniref:Undecaprenyl-phosphate glucose phosphotransferase n=1 Tax=Hymenobacter roseosalivarius DSM 11622 TaxID=645990 RepID=A0A1W1W4S7_9BACT|nr:undecaprenyl-phosphate glucose phosphotransferase [Hymenobacter roseosalivarius]SMC00615.1 Undecaprenyl-phosphate glucose phosphotransferase [Hymenobacter roseosalivarius DSM 11622]
MDRQFLQFRQMLFVVLDLFLLNFGFLVNRLAIEEQASATPLSSHTFYWLLLNVFWVAGTWLGEIYSYHQLSRFRRFTKSSFLLYFIWAFSVLVVSFLLRHYFTSSWVFVYSTFAWFAAALLFSRLLHLVLKVWVVKKAGLNRRIIILGYNKLGQKLATYLEREELSISIVGFVDDAPMLPESSAYQLFAGLSDALAIAKRHGITEIYSTIMPENNSTVYSLMKQADNDLIRLRLVPDFSYFINRPVHVNYIFDMPILSVLKEPLTQVTNQFKKRTFDIIVSFFVTVLILSWLVPVLGLLIYLQSPGPIFFVQLRSGKNNKSFRCFKFRSMTANRAANFQQATTRQDARVTRIGRFMRKTSLDEFPQFLNVLFGHMSIVGPRPHMLKHTKSFSAQEDQYMIRQFLKPGITGWAQVNGYRGEITELRHIQKRVECDLWYLENWSLGLDLKIIFLTVYNVFKGEENAF